MDPPGSGDDVTIRIGASPRMDTLPPAGFQPREPRTWEEAGVDDGLVEAIVLRYLARETTAPGRQIAAELCVSQALVKDLLEQLKNAKVVQHRGATTMGDFVYELTDLGRSKAVEHRKLNSYVGPVPVPFNQYLAGVRDQTMANARPTRENLDRAFEDITLTRLMLDRIGPAIAGGRALFLFGDPGNGKTSIAERITRSFGDAIWIPITLLIDGHIVKFYDPATHEHVPPAAKSLSSAERTDRRWVRIRRPTVIAGGELTLDMLEIQRSENTGICEAPLQLKANGGTLVIDDFGRQRIEPQTLLNRWIFPLERRIDYLRLPDGRKIAAPFDPLLVFSTNLEPSGLVDEAFLRRIPYKIRVEDPTQDQFSAILRNLASDLGILLVPGSVTYLLDTHYRTRPMRFCHPRDLLQQVVDHCRFERRALIATPNDWDIAVANYFSGS